MNIIGDKKRLEGLNVEAVENSTLNYYSIGDVLKNIETIDDSRGCWIKSKGTDVCSGYISGKFKILLDEAFLKIFKERDIVINCKTKDQAEEFCNWMHDNGLKWCDGDHYIDSNKWRDYKSDTCYSAKGGYCNSEYYQKKGYTVVDFSDCIIKNIETKDYKFKIGDKVKVVNYLLGYSAHGSLAKKLKAKNFKYNKRIENNIVCIINNIGLHGSSKDIIICLVEDINTGYEYLIGEDGIEMYQEEQYELVKDATLKDILNAGPCEDGFNDLCNELLEQGCNASEIVNGEIVFNNENFMKYKTIRDNIDWAIEKGFVKTKEKKFESFDITFKVESKDQLLDLYHRMNCASNSIEEGSGDDEYMFPKNNLTTLNYFHQVKEEMYRIE